MLKLQIMLIFCAFYNDFKNNNYPDSTSTIAVLEGLSLEAKFQKFFDYIVPT